MLAVDLSYLVPPRRRSVGDYHERYGMADIGAYIGEPYVSGRRHL
jgi:hypothetical protein